MLNTKPKEPSMNITTEQARYIAKLAKLSFEGEELDKIAREMESIIGWANEITALDTSGVPAMEHVLPLRNVLRQDGEPVPFPRDELLANAPEQKDGCFAVEAAGHADSRGCPEQIR
jgi:aspartyl-tRNA(Asn)/glutamyl-tRNA(Gln) amidotransferase subunit C